jgi:hypothetical protein
MVESGVKHHKPNQAYLKAYKFITVYTVDW